MILAQLETPSFSFVGLAGDRAEALRIMERAWVLHSEQTGATSPWVWIVEDVNLHDIAVGDVLRDGTVLA